MLIQLYLLSEKGWKSKWDSKWLIFVCVCDCRCHFTERAGLCFARPSSHLALYETWRPSSLPHWYTLWWYSNGKRQACTCNMEGFKMSACALHRLVQLRTLGLFTLMTMYYWTHCLDIKVNKMSVDSETSIFVEKLCIWCLLWVPTPIMLLSPSENLLTDAE